MVDVFTDMELANSSFESETEDWYPDWYPPNTELLDFFDPLFFVPIISYETTMIEALAVEHNLEELEWLLRLFTACEPYPVEGVLPLDRAYPFRQQAYVDMVAYIIDPFAGLYEYDGAYYVGPEACYGFDDSDFIYLDDVDPGLALGLPPGLYRILFP